MSDFKDKLKYFLAIVYIGAGFVIPHLEDSVSDKLYSFIQELYTVILPALFLLFAVIYFCIFLYRYWLREKIPTLFNRKAKRNLKKLEETFITVLLYECNKNDVSFSHCKEPLVAQLRFVSETRSSIEDAARWPTNFDYFDLSYKLIVSFSFDMISSGRYHIHRGMLTSQGESLRLMHKHALHYIFSRGLISEQDYTDQISIISENIDSVG